MPETLEMRQRRVYSAGIILSEADKMQLPATFPMRLWNEQQARYMEYWDWYDGLVWEEMVQGTRDPESPQALRYPLQVNIVRANALKHAYVTIGEVPDTPDALVPCRVVPRKRVKPGAATSDSDDKSDDADKELAATIEDYVNDVINENNGRAKQAENMLLYQYLGGCWFRLLYSPDDEELEFGTRMELVVPDFVLPIWDSGNPDNLLEVFVLWRMTPREAMLKYGVEDSGINYAGGSNYLLYVEHWQKKNKKVTVSITLAGKPLVWDNKVWDEQEVPWEVIPFVYIPRERAAGFFGYSIVDDIGRGLMREYNARLADVGDVLSESANRTWFTRNLPSTVRTRNVGEKTMIDLGNSTPGNQNPPEAWAEDPPQLPPTLINYPDFLHDEIGRVGFVPAVAEGKDEGSQRSALTLAFRMWPLTSKARAYRTYWTNGLNRLHKMIATIGIITGRLKGVTMEDLKRVRWMCDWSPMIPRDREQLVNEVVLAVTSGFMAPLTAISVLGQVNDPQEEYDMIKEHKEWESKLAADQKQQEALAKPLKPMATPGVEKDNV